MLSSAEMRQALTVETIQGLESQPKAWKPMEHRGHAYRTVVNGPTACTLVEGEMQVKVLRNLCITSSLH